MAAPTSIPRAIIQNEMICLSTRVPLSASSIPTAASLFPARAVAGELSCFRPKMKSTAATIYAIAIAESRRSSILLLRRALLEHLQHAVSHDEAAEDVRGAEHDCDKSEDVQQRRIG